MKVGQKVYHKNDPTNLGTIFEVNIKKKENHLGEYVSTTYKAIFEDGRIVQFYGNQINHTYIPVESCSYKQLSIFDCIDDKGEQ